MPSELYGVYRGKHVFDSQFLRIAGLEKDLHMVGNQYNIAVTVFTIL